MRSQIESTRSIQYTQLNKGEQFKSEISQWKLLIQILLILVSTIYIRLFQFYPKTGFYFFFDGLKLRYQPVKQTKDGC